GERGVRDRGCRSGPAPAEARFEGRASGAELLLQQLVDLSRAGLALARLHDLTDQGVEGLLLAGAEFIDRLLVGGEYLVDHGLDRAAVGDLLEALLIDDRVRALAFAVPQRLEHLLGNGVRDGVVGDARDQSSELR